MNRPDVVVVGGGHAGVEASLAASRSGSRVILVTMDASAIGRMSCNPAIGGLAKGHLVKEIDALGGIMGVASDYTGIQFKTLNRSKGRAVWSPRAQIDKKQYSRFVQNKIKGDPKITVLIDEIVDIVVNNASITGVKLKKHGLIDTLSVIVCGGTFMNGIIHIGREQYSAGRIGEKAVSLLTSSLISQGFSLSRLKTGTPPRLLSSSINWEGLALAPGDPSPEPFSMLTKRPFLPKNTPCYIAYTNETTHAFLKDNLNESAMYMGTIDSVGPRYCPSIEDKVVRFESRNQHQLFLEPEWENSNQIYVNGFSTSMSRSVQELAIRSVQGLENAEFIRHGYAIEYDYFPTRQLKNTLETKSISGLYFAGQLNGTSGYEEAAAQGLIAGLNASLKHQNSDPFVLDRTEAYIGVLIDDLITKNIDEPYRMFTSSAEHRLSLRPDNAETRLMPKAISANIVSKKHIDIFNKYRAELEKIYSICSANKIRLGDKTVFIEDYLRRPENGIHDATLSKFFNNSFSHKALFSAETEIKYSGYIAIEQERVIKVKKMEGVLIPPNFDYTSIKGLSAESREKLLFVLPQTLGQASRIAGVRASDIGILSMYLASK